VSFKATDGKVRIVIIEAEGDGIRSALKAIDAVFAQLVERDGDHKSDHAHGWTGDRTPDRTGD